MIEFRNIEKCFGEHRVLSGVNLQASPGDVVALMGENGAGKSTLMRILAGVYSKGTYTGDLIVDGKTASFQTVRQAKTAGIAMIHQELGLFPELTVAENILLDEIQGFDAVSIPWTRIYTQAEEFLATLGFKVNAHSKISELSTGNAQLIEIARAIRSNAKVLIMDEPTSALTDSETQGLFRLICELKSQGKIIFYVSHRMEEIKKVCNRVVVLRDGAMAGEGDAATLTQEQIIQWMVGREVQNIYPIRKSSTPAHVGIQPRLKVENFTVKDSNTNRTLVHPTSFELYAGEILGLAGLMGAGRSELALGLYGYYSNVQGRVWMNGNEILTFSPRAALSKKIAMLTEDRKLLGLCLNRPAAENMTLSVAPHLGTGTIIDVKKENALIEKLASELSIRGPSLKANVETYSGGNQQKVYLAKCLALEPQVLILDEPTRGVDIGAKIEIYQMIRTLADRGVAVLLISSEMPELLGLSDRIAVMRAGKLNGVFERPANGIFQPNDIMRAASL